MQHRHGASLADPMLGVYFGIFAACLAAVVLLLLIFEQLGMAEASLKTAMAGISVALFATIGIGAYTSRARDFLAAGRRVPAIYNGIAMSIVVPGGVGLVGLAGSLFLAGFDTLCVGVGMVAGLTVSVMLIAPFLRKFGAPTVPSFLGQRFESGSVRLLAASVAVVPLMLVAIAEIKIAIMAAAWLTPLPPAVSGLLIVLVLIVTVAPGGVRSLSWSTAAQAMVVLVAILLPAGIAAVMETNLPFGQLSHGPLLRAVGRIEAVQAVPVPVAGLLAVDFPDVGLQPITGRFATTFGTIGPMAFVLMALAVLAGVAGSPALLARAATTPSVYDTRKSFGWAVAFVGILLMTFSSVAVFERDILVNSIAGQPAAAIPTGLQRLVDLGLASVESRPARMTATSVLFDRDGMLIALPVLLGMPLAVVNLVAAGVLSAALAGAAASVAQLGIIIGEDVINAPAAQRMSDPQRLWVCRLAIAAGAALAGFGAVLAGGDPLLLLLHAFAISGSALFPVLALSIWWKRTTTTGAIGGMAAGFVIAVLLVLADMSSLGLPALLAPAVAIPAAICATMVLSHLTPAPGRHILEMVRDLRVPGGETIHDREARQARHRAPRTR
jgi:cation/acetate symporter